MARNLAQRLDRLERLAAELLNTNQGPIYLRDGEAIPDGIDPERVVTIKRMFLDPPDMPVEELPETTETSPAIERPSPAFTRPLANPPLGIV
jgi:hypothetical protein